MLVAPRAAWVVMAACLAAGALIWVAGDPPSVEALMGETGPVERLTTVSYLLCAIFAGVARAGDPDRRTTVALVVVMVAFALRELDWHKAFTGTSVLRLSWYASPAPWSTKLAALTALAPGATSRVGLFGRHAGLVGRGWRAARPVATTVVVFFVTLALAKTLDRMVSILSFDLGVQVPLYWVALRSSVEECLELGLSLLMLLGLAQHRAASR
jgi:hypothetical protein